MKDRYDVVIVGSGPAGLFAADVLRQRSELEVLIVEAGREVRRRRCPLDAHCVCPICHVIEGVGGAGAISDGKLTYSLGRGTQGEELFPASAVSLLGYIDDKMVRYGGEGKWVQCNGSACDLSTEHMKFSEYSLRHIGSDGIARALEVCRPLLRIGGYLVFTDAVWRRPDPPQDLKATFDLDYPAMGTVDDLLKTIKEGGFTVIEHFTLADEAWWDDFYTPMEERVQELRPTYASDPEATAALDEIGREPELHRRYHTFYAYEFFVTRLIGSVR